MKKSTLTAKGKRSTAPSKRKYSVLNKASDTSKATAPRGWFRINASHEGAADIEIYDTIGANWFGEGVDGKVFVEELKNIPKTKDIHLRINSPGGNVADGMLIYNRLSERRDRVSVTIDGIAASIASVIALAGKELVMPRNTLLMIHEPWGMAEGNADDMTKAAEMLNKYGDAIASVYEAKTGLNQKQVRDLMKEETWMTGDEAVSSKFADRVTAEISVQACYTLPGFKRAPDSVKALLAENTSEAKVISKPSQTDESGGSQNSEDKLMDRKKILALLKKRGVTVENTATDEELFAMLEGLGIPVEQVPSTQAPAPAPQPKAEIKPGDHQNVDSATIRAELSKVTAFLATERKSRIERAVDDCISEDRLPAAQRDKWVGRALADETVLDDLRAMQPRPPGSSPVGVVITSESIHDIQNGLIALRNPVKSWMRGNAVDPALISANSIQMAREIGKYRKQLDTVLNANTIDSDLKRNVILADTMGAFVRRIVLLNVFTTKFESVPLQGTNKVTFPYYELDTTTSNDFVQATGYVFDHNSDTASRTVTVNKRKYKPMNFSSDDFARQPYFKPNMNMQVKAEQLALDVWLDVLSEVTVAKYGATVLDREPSAMDTDDIVTVRQACQDADWPDIGRALVLSTSHESALLQDDSLKHFMNSNSDQPLRAGATGRLLGFETFYSPRIPTNSEDLGGFAALPGSLLVATAPIVPAPGVRSTLLSYDVVTDPMTGVAFEYRYWGNADADEDREIVECNYGFLAGNASALKRITNGAAANESSSSSSASSASTTSASSASTASSQSSSQSSASSQG